MPDRNESNRDARESDALQPRRSLRPRLGITPADERLSLPERALQRIRRRSPRTGAPYATDDGAEVDRAP